MGMIHKYGLDGLDGGLNPYKHHLARLPAIPKDRQIHNYPGASFDALVIFPLFQTNEGDQSLENHICNSACWARRSWLLFSDAIDLDIKIGFYVGDTVTDRVFPILQENGIDVDTDVFLLEEAPFEGNPTTHLGKKLSFFNDTQFADYDWVLQMDADMFLASPSREKNDFFAWFDGAEKKPYAVRANIKGASQGDHRNIDHHHWWHCLLHSEDTQEKIEEWIARARTLVDDSVVDCYLDPTKYITTCHGGIYAFPLKHYQTEKRKDCEWIAKAGKLLQDDEATFSLWHMKGREFGCLSREQGIFFCTEVSNIYEAAEKANPTYLSHFATFYEEWKWREDIDAL